MENVGLIGYGRVGSAFAERMFATSGIRPLVYDIDARACQRARDAGLEVASSSAEVGERCEIVDVIPATDEEVLDATTGPAGVLANVRPGTTLLLHPTVLPKTTIAIGEIAAQRGVDVADACVSGADSTIRAGKLVFLLGASDEVAKKVDPHLRRMAAHVLHMGPLGSGNITKLMKNLVRASERLIMWEMLQVGEAAGISYVDALEMMRFVTQAEDYQSEVHHWERCFDETGADSLVWSAFGSYSRVVPITAELGRSYGLDLPITEQIAAQALRVSKLNEGRTWPPPGAAHK